MNYEIEVHKFGGKTTSSIDLIRAILKFEKQKTREGIKIVMVVSARGDRTNELEKELPFNYTDEQYNSIVSVGEIEAQDFMLKANNLMFDSVKAVGLPVKDLEFLTKGDKCNAEPVSISKEIILKLFEKYDLIIVPGFQGIDKDDGELTTLGRGGSDTTAVSIAASLNCKCVFYKKALGITAFDPSFGSPVVLDNISYDNATILSKNGYQFLMPMSLKLAKKYGVPLEFRVSPGFEGDPNKTGTIISSNGSSSDNDLSHFSHFRAIAVKDGLVAVEAKDVPNMVGESARFFSKYGDKSWDVQQHGLGSTASIFVLYEQGKIQIFEADDDAVLKSDLACVTYIDTDMNPETNFVSQISDVLAEAGVNIFAQNSSEDKIHTTVEKSQVKSAVLALAKKFELCSL